MLSLFSISILAILFSFLLYQYIIFPVFLSPLSKIPNAHFTVPVLPWIWFKRRGGRTAISSIYSAHKKYGPLIRISSNEVSVSTLDGIHQIYSNAFKKTDFYLEFINFKTPNMVSMLDNKPHSDQKRHLSHVYSNSYISNSADLQILSKVILFERLVPALKSASGMIVDVYSLNQAISTDFGTAYFYGITNSTNLIEDTGARERWHRNVRTKMRFLPEKDKASEEVERDALALCQAAEDFIHSEKPSGNTPVSNPIVYKQLSSRFENSPSPFSQSSRIATASETLDHTIAVQETARVTFTYLQWELSRRPALQSSLRTELLTLAPSLIASPSSDHLQPLPTPQTLDTLPLLDAVLKETLRLYPSSPSLLPRMTPPEGAIIDGYIIPGGTLIGSSAYCMHRNESVFPDPEAFKPERWLCDEKELREMMRWYWPFASGPRMCIGSHFALYMLKIVVATMYSNFETSIVDDEGIEQEDAFLATPVGEKLVLKFQALS